jgi:hypothetical protein
MTDLENALEYLGRLQFICYLPFEISKYENCTEIIINDSIVLSFDKDGKYLETEEI